ncbi:hypothetical protein SFRURICE_005681 [Spodoptera frugiperda]|nr:hypothetical protein SFRURICE_005681 [Spodoptera frugiperda]
MSSVTRFILKEIGRGVHYGTQCRYIMHTHFSAFVAYCHILGTQQSHLRPLDQRGSISGAFPPEMCYATLLWMRLVPIIFFGTHNLALVEMDSTNLCFLYGKMRAMDACNGCMRAMDVYIAYSSCASSSYSLVSVEAISFTA